MQNKANGERRLRIYFVLEQEGFPAQELWRILSKPLTHDEGAGLVMDIREFVGSRAEESEIIGPSTECSLRHGQIALAYLKHKAIKEGLKVDRQEIRTKAGKIVQDLNAENTGLNITIDEVLAVTKYLVDAVVDDAFRLSRSQAVSDKPDR